MLTPDPSNPASSRDPGPSPEPAAVAGLGAEIGKRRPFDCPEQEAFLNIIRAAAVLSADFHKLFREHGLSEAGYNALRILRGGLADPAGVHGRTCSQIGDQLVAHVPDVTRLVDRLEQMGLAERRRCEKDRRVVYVAITPKGLDVLKSLDAPVLALHSAQMAHMTPGQLDQLSDLLVEARKGAAASRTAPNPSSDPHSRSISSR